MEVKDIIEKVLAGNVSETRIFKDLGDERAIKLYDRLCKSEKLVNVEGYNEPIKLYFSAEEGDLNFGTGFNVEAYSAMGQKLGSAKFQLDIVCRLGSLEVEAGVLNRNSIAEVLLEEVEEAAKEASRTAVVGFNYQKEDEQYEELYKNLGYIIEVGDALHIVRKDTGIENANTDESENDL